mgnify:CR=1 FL=1
MLQFSARATLLAAMLLLAPAFATAKTWTIPDPNPVAVVTIPDDWDTTKLKYGVETTSEDEDIYLAIEGTDGSSIEKDMEHSIEWLVSKGVKIDAKSLKQEPFKLNDMDGIINRWDAKDDDGATQVFLIIVQTSDKKGLMITAWGTEEAQKENKDELTAIMKSIRAVK